FLFARDERDSVRARLLDRAVIDLAGEKPERQADHPARMGEHPLDRVMGLAGVGRPKQDRDTPRAVPRKRFGGRERNVHWLTGAEKDRACAGAGRVCPIRLRRRWIYEITMILDQFHPKT